MKRFAFAFPLLLLLTGLIPAQVFLPHRTIGTSSLVAPFCTDCGCVPVSQGLVQWLCPDALFVAGRTNGQNITNWFDVSPAHTNGVYASNIFGSAFVYPQLGPTNGFNHTRYVFLGSASQNSAMLNSNAWYASFSSAEIIYVIQYLSNTTVVGLEHMGSQLADEIIYGNSASTSNRFGFGSSAVKVSTNVNGSVKALGSLVVPATNVPPVILNIFTAANDFGFYTNGTLCYSTNVNTVAWPNSPTGAIYGVTIPTGWQFNGPLYELFAFDHKLTTTERAAMVSWLRSSAKYNF